MIYILPWRIRYNQNERNLKTSFDIKCYHFKYFILSTELFKFAKVNCILSCIKQENSFRTGVIFGRGRCIVSVVDHWGKVLFLGDPFCLVWRGMSIKSRLSLLWQASLETARFFLKWQLRVWTVVEHCQGADHWKVMKLWIVWCFCGSIQGLSSFICWWIVYWKVANNFEAQN